MFLLLGPQPVAPDIQRVPPGVHRPTDRPNLKETQMDRHTDHPRSTRLTLSITRRPRAATAARLLGLALAVALLASLLAPLTGSAQDGAAQDEPAPTETADPAGQDDGGEGDGATTDEPPVADDAPVAEETPVAEEPPVAELAGQEDPYLSRIIVFMRTCTDTYDDDFARLDANCKAAPAGHSFDVYGVDNAGKGMQQTGTSYLDVSGLGAGQYTIRSFTPNDYRSPTVFCSRGTYPDPQGPMAETVTYDGYYEFTLVPGERIACHWFYVPTVTGYGGLTVVMSACPPVEAIPFPFDYATADYFDLAIVCSIYRDAAVPFLVYSHANGFNLTVHTTPSTGTVSWTTLAAGKQTVSTAPRPGFDSTRAFCFFSNDQANFFEVTAEGWEAKPDVKVGLTTVCDYFAIPAEEAEAEAEEPEAPLDSGTVAITVHGCNDPVEGEFDPYSSGRDDLKASCIPYTFNEMGFDLSHAGTGETDARSTGETADGAALWEGVGGGDLTVTGTDLSGYGAPVVYCAAYNPAALVFEPTYEQVDATNGRFAYELPDDFSMSCDWFSIPDGGDGDVTDDGDGDGDGDVTDGKTGSVTVVAYACPEDAAKQGGFAVYEETCTATEEGAIFKLDGDRSGNPGEQTTGADGSAVWSDREADRFSLYEQDVPARHGAPAVFCDTYLALDGLVPDYAAYEVSEEGRIAFDLAEGESITCRWFDLSGAEAVGRDLDQNGVEVETQDEAQDIAQDETLNEAQDDVRDGIEDGGDAQTTGDEPGSITVFGWRCPAGFDLAADTNPWIACDQAGSEIELAIAGPGGVAAARTVGDDLPGGVRWDDLGAGDYEIDDTEADDVASGFVLTCAGGDVPVGYPVHSTAAGEPFALSLEAGQHVTCLWFAVPADAA